MKKIVLPIIICLLFVVASIANTIIGASVVRVNPRGKTVTIQSGAEDIKTYKVTKKTEIFKGGVKINLNQLKKGDTVNVITDDSGCLLKIED